MSKDDLFGMIHDLRQLMESSRLLNEYSEEMAVNIEDILSKYSGNRAREILDPYAKRFSRMANVIMSNALLRGMVSIGEDDAKRVETESIEDVYHAICEGYLLGYYDRGQDVLLSMQVTPDQGKSD